MTDSMTEATEAELEAVDAHDDHDDHGHPSDWDYVKIALWLGLFTLIEVGTYFESVHNLPDWALYVSLTVLMVIKFVMVGAYFMHLKYDSPWFSRIFVTGIVLALGVYIILFFAFDLFGLAP